MTIRAKRRSTPDSPKANKPRLNWQAAEKGAAATKHMVAAAGRSSYVPVEVMKTVPDPGATAAAAWIRGVAIAIA